jgi:uncharacterized protein YndB with AHSA1/START domain
MKKTDPPIIVKESFQSSVEKVWSAITQLEEMTQWYFENIPSFQAKVGFETQFPVQSEDRVFTHLWKVTEVIPFQKITYTWTYKEYAGDAYVTFDLIENDNHVTLAVSLIVTEDFPTGIPEFTRENCIGGWEYFIGNRLKAYLANTKN